jgi:hypothetical protein
MRFSTANTLPVCEICGSYATLRVLPASNGRIANYLEGLGMRRDEVISREELLRPDILSEIVLLGSGIAVLVAFVMVAMAAFASPALQ